MYILGYKSEVPTAKIIYIETPWTWEPTSIFRTSKNIIKTLPQKKNCILTSNNLKELKLYPGLLSVDHVYLNKFKLNLSKEDKYIFVLKNYIQYQIELNKLEEKKVEAKKRKE